MQKQRHLGFAAPYDAHEVRPACKSGNIEVCVTSSPLHPAIILRHGRIKRLDIALLTSLLPGFNRTMFDGLKVSE